MSPLALQLTEGIMGYMLVNGRDGIRVVDAIQMLGMFLSEAVQDAEQLQKRLNDNPMSFEEIEREVLALFDRGAGLFLTGLISKTMVEPSFQQRAAQLREEYAVDLKKGSERMIQTRMGNGFVGHAVTEYCPPKRNQADDPSLPGLDVELSQFGFSGGDSPALVSKVARSTALNPSLDVACQQLLRDGVVLDKSTVDRISSRAAQELLTVRERDLQAFRDGTLQVTDDLAGKTVSVQIDGGRTRTRVPGIELNTLDNLGKTQSEATGRESMGRSKEQRRHATFQAIWREPKVVIIYVHDNQGRRSKEYRVTIDGTLGDVEDMTEIVAMHLYRLGAASAASICFNSDGAVWIWDRITTILSLAKIPASVMIHQVLDIFHACENLHKAIDELMPPSPERTMTYRSLRSTLRDGKWTSVITALENMSSEQPGAAGSSAAFKETRRVIEYLRSHGERGHLDYSTFRVMGLPLGSGSIESAIRRVVNLRMKGNGIFWRLQRAEEMLMLRSTILSDRWDDNRLRAKRALQANGKLSLPAYLTPKPDAKQSATKNQ
jgi:hypothetical protein